MDLRKFVPFDSFKLYTHLPKREVKERIEMNVEPDKGFSWSTFSSRKQKPYEGVVYEDSFTINRIIHYSNAFLPTIYGILEENQEKGTIITIKMNPFVPGLILMSIWLGGTGIFCLAVIVSGFSNFREVVTNGFSPALVMPFFMFAFGYALLTIAYRIESEKSKSFLIQLFRASVIR